MLAYRDNTANTIDTRDSGIAIPYQTDWQGLKRAQSIIKTYMTDCTKEECEVLIERLLKSVVKSTLESQNHVKMAVKTVIDWHNEVFVQSLHPLRSRLKVFNFASNQNLLTWQYDLLCKITLLPYVSKVYIFEKKGLSYFWIISQKPSTEMIMRYSQEYVNILQQTPDLDIDFMVFGEEEVEYYQIPNTAFIFDNKG